MLEIAASWLRSWLVEPARPSAVALGSSSAGTPAVARAGSVVRLGEHVEGATDAAAIVGAF